MKLRSEERYTRESALIFLTGASFMAFVLVVLFLSR